jgi:hypothetical protein
MLTPYTSRYVVKGAGEVLLAILRSTNRAQCSVFVVAGRRLHIVHLGTFAPLTYIIIVACDLIELLIRC